MSRTPLLWQKLVAWLGRGSLGQESSPISNESSPLELGTVLDPTQLTEGVAGTLTPTSETLKPVSLEQFRITPHEALQIQQHIATKLHGLGLPAVTFPNLEQQIQFYAQHGLTIQCFYETTYRAMIWAAVTSELVVKASQTICLSTDADNIIGQAAFTGYLYYPLEVIYLDDPVPLLRTMKQGVALWPDTVPKDDHHSLQWRLFFEYVLRPSLLAAQEAAHGTK